MIATSMSIRALCFVLSFALLPSPVRAADARPPAERGRVGFYALAEPSAAGASAVDRLVPYASRLVRPLLDAELAPVNAHGASDAEIARTCSDERVNAIVIFFYADKTTVDGAKRAELAEAHLDVFDCYGDIAFDGAGTAEGDRVYDEARIATDRAFSALRSGVRAGGTSLANLVRYGFPIETGEKTTGLALRAGALGARARPMAFGTAARAGIHRDDLITSLNGTSLAGLDAAALDALLAAVEAAGGTYVAVVTAADGKTARYAFASQDLAGYLRL